MNYLLTPVNFPPINNQLVPKFLANSALVDAPLISSGLSLQMLLNDGSARAHPIVEAAPECVPYVEDF